MDYKKKYLKYKLKYLQAKQTFKGGIRGGEEEGEAPAEEGVLIVTVSTDCETKEITVTPTDAVHDAIAAGFERPGEVIEEALLGDDAVQPGETFQDWGIEEGARLSVRFRPRVTFEEFLDDIVEMNPQLAGTTRLERARWVSPEWRRERGFSQTPSRVRGNLDLRNAGIDVLPESIGDLTVDGYLSLRNNNLATLPESIGSLTVRGDLDLSYNGLTTLPASFGNLQVRPGAKVDLRHNPIARLQHRPHFDGLWIKY